MLVPRNDFEIVDDWCTMGLSATGSKQVLVADAFVPFHRVVPRAYPKSYDMSAWILGCIAIGAAEGA